MRVLFFTALLMLIAAPCFAQEKYMQLDLADTRVDITTGFDGTNVVLFGTLTDDTADVVVTIKGPEKTMVVRKKDHIAGSWINHESIEFRRVPSFYDYSMTAGEKKIVNEKVAQDAQIGVDNLDFYPEDESEKPEVVDTFHDALIRRMQSRGLFPIRPSPLQFIDPHFFKATFELPAGVPTGIYTLEAVLIKNDAILARETKTLQVGQVGFNAKVYLFAENKSFFYGLLCVLIAAFSGWSAFTFLRRD